MVRLPDDKSALVGNMADADKQLYFNQIVGAATVEGEIEKMDHLSPPSDPALVVGPELAGPASLFIHKDPKKAVLSPLEPGQGTIVMAFRRNHAAAANRFGLLQLFVTTRRRAIFNTSRATGKRSATRPATSSASPPVIAAPLMS